MIGMSQSVVNNWCTGKREPSLNALCAICKALGESAGFLIGTEDY
ncbi:MAG: helix-turn-helix transcriptional regulator [Clostridia bacterium]|nr:helix-turn-helix transcriptional regulator [Clostridia bacterium]